MAKRYGDVRAPSVRNVGSSLSLTIRSKRKAEEENVKLHMSCEKADTTRTHAG